MYIKDLLLEKYILANLSKINNLIALTYINLTSQVEVNMSSI